MRLFVKILSIFLILSLVLLPFLAPKLVYSAEGDTQWARSTVAGSTTAYFNGVATDSSGNIYAVGLMNGTGTFNFGNGVTVAGGYSSNNIIIVKYNSDGLAQWAKSTVVGPSASIFYGVSIDSSGNIYAAGSVIGNGTFDFGNSVTVAGGGTGNNAIVVKYNSSGVAQWAKSTVVGPSNSVFNGISLDLSGNIYAAGKVDGTGTYNFGNSVTAAGGNAGSNTLIVKYNSSGVAQWAASTTVAPSTSIFHGISTDLLGNSYAIGYVIGNGTFDFGNSVTVAGGGTGNNTIIVKYNSSGAAQWAVSTTTAPAGTVFTGVSTDSSGNSYAVGYFNGAGPFNYGNSVTVTGAHPSSNFVIVKYNSSGLAQWAKSTVVAPGDSYFGGVSTDSSGNIYAVGYIYNSGTFNFGNSVTVTVDNVATNVFIIKYDSNGLAQWAKSTAAGTVSDYSTFYGVSADSSGNVYAVGEIDGIQTYNLGTGVTVSGTYSGANIIIVKYGSGTATIITAGQASSSDIQIPQMTDNPPSIVATPIKDSSPQGQQVLTIIQPQTFGFDAYLYSSGKVPSSLISVSEKGTDAFLNGGAGGILSIKTFLGTYWQVGKIEEIWYKSYPPEGHSAAIIIPELQTKPSIIAFRYTEGDLIPIGRPKGRYNPKNFKLAHSLDGKKWAMLKSTVDTVNRTVAVVDKVGGYYMIVGK